MSIQERMVARSEREKDLLKYGRSQERERIIKMLKEHTPFFAYELTEATECNGCDWQWNYLDDSRHQDHLIALIKGENK